MSTQADAGSAPSAEVSSMSWGAVEELYRTPLDAEACRRRLASARSGRLAVVIDGEPLVEPVTFRLLGDALIIPCGEDAVLAAAVSGQPSALEIDRRPAGGQDGYSLLVQGRLSVVDDADEVERLEGVWFLPRPVTSRKVYARLEPHRIAGDRISRQPQMAVAMLDDQVRSASRSRIAPD
jgi:nitroimidazol reductase NimA-like FMN-containing flavoprotein (pyridoxamine 5'-phosphate oxidase superfamily)